MATDDDGEDAKDGDDGDGYDDGDDDDDDDDDAVGGGPGWGSRRGPGRGSRRQIWCNVWMLSGRDPQGIRRGSAWGPRGDPHTFSGDPLGDPLGIRGGSAHVSGDPLCFRVRAAHVLGCSARDHYSLL